MTGHRCPRLRRGRDARADAGRTQTVWLSWSLDGPGRAKPAARAAARCVPARLSSTRGSILEPARLGVLASVGRTEVSGRAPASGGDRAHRRRAGRARPGAGTGPDSQLERRDAPGPGDRGGARALVLPIAPDDAGPLGRASGAGSRPTFCSSPAVCRPASAILFRRPWSLWVSNVSSIRFAQARQASLVWCRAATGRSPRNAGFWAAGQSGERPRRLSVVRQGGLAVLAGRPASRPGWTRSATQGRICPSR